MIFQVDFVIDNGCRRDKHVAFLKAPDVGKAIFEFNEYIYSNLGYDESLEESSFTALKDESVLLYCTFQKRRRNT